MKSPAVHAKRVYDQAAGADGYRVLVDRLWPRGLAKSALPYDLWCKDLAPSPALRRWFGHKLAHWDGFREAYTAELREPDRQQAMADMLASAQGRSTITLLYGARDTEHNHALILADEIMRHARHPGH